MKTKCILFDCDGVVINSEMFSVQYQKKFGVSNDEMLPFFNGIFADCKTGKADLKKVIKPYLNEWKWPGTVDKFLEFWFKAEHHYDKKLVKIIKNLKRKNIRCCLVTDNEKYRMRYIRKDMGFDKIFDKIYSSAEIGLMKKQKGFFEFVVRDLKKHKIKKQEIIYFDDSKDEIKQAKKFGLNAKIYKSFNDFKKQINIILKP